MRDLSIRKFAGDNNNTLKFIDRARDYYFHYMSEVANKKIGVFDSSVSLQEKENKINKDFLNEVMTFANFQAPAQLNPVHFATNPTLRWAAFAIVDMIIQAVLPETIVNSIGVYTDIRNIGWGDSAQFEIKPRALMTISTGGHGQRTTFRQKEFSANKTLLPINHNITVYSSLYKVLAGKEFLAEFVRKAILSMDTEMTRDAYSAFHTGLNAANYPSSLVVTGYTQEDLLHLCEVVTAYNQGDKAVIVGTSVALSKILPSQANNYRIVTPSEAISIQLIQNFFNYDILVLPQVSTANYEDYGLLLDDTQLYVISPSTDKLIKGVIEGVTLNNSNDYYDNANLTSNSTINKSWAFEYVSNATAGLVKLS